MKNFRIIISCSCHETCMIPFLFLQKNSIYFFLKLIFMFAAIFNSLSLSHIFFSLFPLGPSLSLSLSLSRWPSLAAFLSLSFLPLSPLLPFSLFPSLSLSLPYCLSLSQSILFFSLAFPQCLTLFSLLFSLTLFNYLTFWRNILVLDIISDSRLLTSWLGNLSSRHC